MNTMRTIIFSGILLIVQNAWGSSALDDRIPDATVRDMARINAVASLTRRSIAVLPTSPFAASDSTDISASVPDMSYFRQPSSDPVGAASSSDAPAPTLPQLPKNFQEAITCIKSLETADDGQQPPQWTRPQEYLFEQRRNFRWLPGSLKNFFASIAPSLLAITIGKYYCKWNDKQTFSAAAVLGACSLLYGIYARCQTEDLDEAFNNTKGQIVMGLNDFVIKNDRTASNPNGFLLQHSVALLLDDVLMINGKLSMPRIAAYAQTQATSGEVCYSRSPAEIAANVPRYPLTHSLFVRNLHNGLRKAAGDTKLQRNHEIDGGIISSSLMTAGCAVLAALKS